MIRTLPILSARKTALCAAAALLALAGCDERLAGTSVGTGNPTEIQVGFKDGTGSPVKVTGTLEVYASTQIPVPGYSTKPLLSYPLSGGTSGGIAADDFARLPDSLWSKASADSGTVYRFNVVVAGAQSGTILKDIGFNKSSREFELPSEYEDALKEGGKARITGVLAPLVQARCIIDAETLSADRKNYLYIPGTGYTALGEGGRFTFAALPMGKYEPLLVSLPFDSHNTSGEDSVAVFRLSAAIETGTESTVAVGVRAATIALPDSLAHPKP
jgi:hypothetical protein